MCAACHNTRLRKNYEPQTNSYHTKMAEMSVGCEACHGPMNDHVAWQKNKPAELTAVAGAVADIASMQGISRSRRSKGIS